MALWPLQVIVMSFRLYILLVPFNTVIAYATDQTRLRRLQILSIDVFLLVSSFFEILL